MKTWLYLDDKKRPRIVGPFLLEADAVHYEEYVELRDMETIRVVERYHWTAADADRAAIEHDVDIVFPMDDLLAVKDPLTVEKTLRETAEGFDGIKGEAYRLISFILHQMADRL